MKRRKPILTYVIFILMGIGILIQISEGSQTLLTAAIVFGAVFLLYKFPPATWKYRWRQKVNSRSSNKKRSSKFRVVDGKKKDNERRPPYH